MATSGTFTGSRGGGSTGPYLTLDWTRVDVDEVNNKSQVTLTLKLNADYSLNFSASKTGSLDGTSFTYTGGFSGTGSKTIKTVTKWLNHNSDGSLSVVFDGDLDIAISWSGSTVNTLTVSGTASITSIPRASDFTAFSLTNTTLNVNTAVTVNYTLNRKSTSFSQDMTLKYGSTVIKSWNTASTGALTQALSTTEVNSIINAMSTVTSGTLTLTMQTKSGSTNIGSLASRTVTVTLNSAIVPTATSLSASIYGTGRDKTINQYVQTISKVTASFTRTAGYGASISSSIITVKRKSDGGDSQTISSNSGTTANAVKLAGTYTVTGTVTDSRGKTASVSVDITVAAYAAPTITTFSTVRDTTLTTNVKATLSLSWSQLGTSNPADISVVGVDNTGASSTLYSVTGSTAGIMNTTQTYTAQSDASAYTYTLTVTDSFGKIGKATGKISTSFVELTLSKGMGIGVGKVWERGALDVKGLTYLDGDVDILNHNLSNVNHLTFNDVGGSEGIEWLDATNNYKIVVSPDDGSNATGPLQIFRNGVRLITFGTTSGIYQAMNNAPLYQASSTGANKRSIHRGTDDQLHINADSFGDTIVHGKISADNVDGKLSHLSGYLNIFAYDSSYGTGNCRLWWNQNGKTLSLVDSTNTLAYLKCSGAGTTSDRDGKTNVEQFTVSALEGVSNTPVYKYNLKSEIEIVDDEGNVIGWEDPATAEKYVGLMWDEAPDDIKDDGDNKTIDLYSMNSYMWKAIQELKQEIDILKGA